LEVDLHKISIVVQEFHVKITDLEAWVTQPTPLEELELWETELKEAVARLTTLEEECQKSYNDVGQIWNCWIEDEPLKHASQNVREVQEQLEKLHVEMVMIAIKDKMLKIHE